MNTFILNENERIQLALLSLDGLSIGDGFGERFFSATNAPYIRRRTPPPPFWSWTDDTAMAISIVRTLQVHGQIQQDDLASRFATVFASNPGRGYGPGAVRLLDHLHKGIDWREASRAMFSGTGSMGNGGAMRAAPLGAWFADDLDRVVSQAKLSAEVTHAHPEGQAGAVATAVAAALAYRVGKQAMPKDFKNLMQTVAVHTPDGSTRIGLKQAAVLPRSISVEDAARTLGCGTKLTSADTVPFCLWCAFHHLDCYEDALWTCVSAGGDVDTTAAIVGGIVALAVGHKGVPDTWRQCREPLPPLV